MWKIDNLLSKAECQEATAAFDRMKENVILYPDGSHLYNVDDPRFRQEDCFETSIDGARAWSWFGSPMLDAYVPRIEAFVREKLDLTGYRYSHTYTREYVKGTRLDPHIDNDKLDITMSVCLAHDFDGEYTLNVYNKENTEQEILTYDRTYRELGADRTTKIYSDALDPNDFTRVELLEGEGALMFGRYRFHYRDPFPENGQRGIYVFYHWTKI